MNPNIPPRVGPEPSTLVCPSCRATVETKVFLKPTGSTHLWALCLFCFCCPFTFVPYCIDSCQQATHYCPNCNAYLGSYST